MLKKELNNIKKQLVVNKFYNEFNNKPKIVLNNKKLFVSKKQIITYLGKITKLNKKQTKHYLKLKRRPFWFMKMMNRKKIWGKKKNWLKIIIKKTKKFKELTNKKRKYILKTLERNRNRKKKKNYTKNKYKNKHVNKYNINSLVYKTFFWKNKNDNNIYVNNAYSNIFISYVSKNINYIQKINYYNNISNTIANINNIKLSIINNKLEIRDNYYKNIKYGSILKNISNFNKYVNRSRLKDNYFSMRNSIPVYKILKYIGINKYNYTSIYVTTLLNTLLINIHNTIIKHIYNKRKKLINKKKIIKYLLKKKIKNSVSLNDKYKNIKQRKIKYIHTKIKKGLKYLKTIRYLLINDKLNNKVLKQIKYTNIRNIYNKYIARKFRFRKNLYFYNGYKNRIINNYKKNKHKNKHKNKKNTHVVKLNTNNRLNKVKINIKYKKLHNTRNSINIKKVNYLQKCNSFVNNYKFLKMLGYRNKYMNNRRKKNTYMQIIKRLDWYITEFQLLKYTKRTNYIINKYKSRKKKRIRNRSSLYGGFKLLQNKYIRKHNKLNKHCKNFIRVLSGYYNKNIKKTNIKNKNKLSNKKYKINNKRKLYINNKKSNVIFKKNNIKYVYPKNKKTHKLFYYSELPIKISSNRKTFIYAYIFKKIKMINHYSKTNYLFLSKIGKYYKRYQLYIFFKKYIKVNNVNMYKYLINNNKKNIFNKVISNWNLFISSIKGRFRKSKFIDHLDINNKKNLLINNIFTKVDYNIIDIIQYGRYVQNLSSFHGNSFSDIIKKMNKVNDYYINNIESNILSKVYTASNYLSLIPNFFTKAKMRNFFKQKSTTYFLYKRKVRRIIYLMHKKNKKKIYITRRYNNNKFFFYLNKKKIINTCKNKYKITHKFKKRNKILNISFSETARITKYHIYYNNKILYFKSVGSINSNLLKKERRSREWRRKLSEFFITHFVKVLKRYKHKFNYIYLKFKTKKRFMKPLINKLRYYLRKRKKRMRKKKKDRKFMKIKNKNRKYMRLLEGSKIKRNVKHKKKHKQHNNSRIKHKKFKNKIRLLLNKYDNNGILLGKKNINYTNKIKFNTRIKLNKYNNSKINKCVKNVIIKNNRKKIIKKRIKKI